MRCVCTSRIVVQRGRGSTATRRHTPRPLRGAHAPPGSRRRRCAGGDSGASSCCYCRFGGGGNGSCSCSCAMLTAGGRRWIVSPSCRRQQEHGQLPARRTRRGQLKGESNSRGWKEYRVSARAAWAAMRMLCARACKRACKRLRKVLSCRWRRHARHAR